MDNIIASIESMIHQPEFQDIPIMIYVGIGTFAGLMTNDDGIMYLEDKNYHQFPPCIQKI